MNSAKVLAYARQNALLLGVLAGVIVLCAATVRRHVVVDRHLVRALAEVNARVQLVQKDGARQRTLIGLDDRVSRQATAGNADLLPALRTIFAETGATFAANDIFAGHNHADVRRFAIFSRLDQIEPRIVFAGDSIIEASAIDAEPAYFNAGVGAAVLPDVIDLVARMKHQEWRGVSCLVVQVGVNDANLAPVGLEDRYSAAFAAGLKRLVSLVEGQRPIVLFTALEPDPSFDTMKVNLNLLSINNRAIIDTAGVAAFDIATAFRKAFANYSDAFTDGIHLSPAGYEVWDRLAKEGASTC